MPPKTTQDQWIFVGGPAVRDDGAQTRSDLMRRVHSERRARKRRELIVPINLPRTESNVPRCTCIWEITEEIQPSGQGSVTAAGYRPIRPRLDAPTTSSPGRCSSCGGPLLWSVREREGRRSPGCSSPSSPFIGLHALHLYGSRDYNALHWSVIQDLVRKHGGILSLQVFALAWLLSVSDIMAAVSTIGKPIHPMLGLDGKVLDLESPIALFQPHEPHHIFPNMAGSGFLKLVSMSPPVKEDVIGPFVHLGEYSCILQHYACGVCRPVVIDLLGDCRNQVHHRFLSLPNENDPVELILVVSDETAEEIELSRDIYLACRLSLILYAIHVTFPIPRSTGLREMLLQTLPPLVNRLVAQNVTDSWLLWSVSVMRIALYGDASGRLPELQRRLCRDLEVDSLHELLEVLRSFAWVDAAAEHYYQAMWKDLFWP